MSETLTLDQVRKLSPQPVASDPSGEALTIDDVLRLQRAAAGAPEPTAPPSFLDSLRQAAKPEFADEAAALAAGLGKGAGNVGLNVQDYLGKGLSAVGLGGAGGWLSKDAQAGREKIAGEVAPYKASSPKATGAGELGGEILATLPVGSLLAKAGGAVLPAAVKSSPTASKVLSAIRSSGTTLGTPAAATTAGKLADLGIRSAGGAITGGVTAGLVDPKQAGTGALIGGAFPLTTAAAGAAGRKIGGMLRSNPPSDEVAALAQRAKELGIDVPADRLVNSRPLNATAASLNYVPFSGRAATEDRVQSQLNRALSRTFGQDSDNVTMALRRAAGDLGGKFDSVLKSNTVRVDEQFMSDLAGAAQRATRELSEGDAKVILNQIDDIIAKSQNGAIDGQAAYNIKKTLDRIGNRKSNEAFYAIDLKKHLMDALNRSLGPDQAQAFAKTRQQYGNMLALEKIAQNGAEGDISIGRLANMKNINNADLQELADVAAQFLKTRENPHGAMQRVAMAGLGGAAGLAGGLPGWLVAGGMVGAGRAANTALNSNLARDLILYGSSPAVENTLSTMLPLTSKAAPVLSAQ
jgi:hypothetical protein